MSSDAPLSRRSFLVKMGGTVLGMFAIPALGDQGRLQAGGSMPECPIDNDVRRIFNRPVWGEDGGFLLWTETVGVKPDLSHRVMIWRIRTDEERAEAERFYAAVTWRSWTDPDELRARPRQPGPWVVRWMNLRQVWKYVTTDADPASVGEHDVFVDRDPRKAAVMSHSAAIDLALGWMERLGWFSSNSYYFEPTPQSDALDEFAADS